MLQNDIKVPEYGATKLQYTQICVNNIILVIFAH